MPIKFACPKCKTVLQVSSKMAGQQGKCKCGLQFKIPTPKVSAAKKAPQQKAASSPGTKPAQPQQAAAPAPPPSAPSPAMFDELAESDFVREDPYKKVYEKKETGNTNETLSKFDIGEDLSETQQRKEAGKAQVWETIGIYCTLGLIQIGVLAVVWTFFEADAKANVSAAREAAVNLGDSPEEAVALEQAANAFFRIVLIILIALSSIYFICAGTFFYLPMTSAIIAMLLFLFQQVLYIIANPLTLVSIWDWAIRGALFGGFIRGINNAAYYSYIKKQKD